MKLHGTPSSNFTAKCLIVVREKGLQDVVELVRPPGDDPSASAYLAINPLGRIPALEVDGTVILESEVINEYLEDRFPKAPLLPADPLGRARARVISRFHDLYLEAALRVLYPKRGKVVGPEVLDAGLAHVRQRLDQLERMLSEPWAAGAAFTLGDCALAPTMLFASLLMRVLHQPSPVAGRPRLQAWWQRVRTRASVRDVLNAQRAALEAS